ncbi:MAG: PfkB family carbohydrate kinase [Acidobacteria bacterium]|nr:PfkB family carbohydrate kinase [Acidobacteriota bacterium]MCI0721690.1 PfkB family carbohydrate kinase [Acidobacteriota bacterium]
MLTQDLVNQFGRQTILVAGDTYVDREIYGEVLRLAPEAPVPVVKVKSKRSVPGGAANVAKNIALLGGKVILCGNFAEDAVSRELWQGLPSENVGCLTACPGLDFPLPERYRIFAANQQLLQMWGRPGNAKGVPLPQSFMELASTGETRAQVLVVYDQGYGAVDADLLRAIDDLRGHSSIKVVIDAHPEHVSWYGAAELFTFNAEESLEAARRLGAPVETVKEAGQVLSEKLGSDILITQGGEGMAVFERSSVPQRIPASRVPLADRAGAGDSSTAVVALCLAAGAPLRQAAELANKAAGVVVAKPGIAYVSPEELMNLFHEEISHLLLESVDVKQRLLREQLPAIESVVRTIVGAYREGKTVYAFGNGGSAADANHFITELVGRFIIERKALPALSFSTNEILMTSIANDYGYENTFARQVDAFVRQGDLVVAFSTSGKSRNVVIALELARRKGATTIGFTGNAAGEFPGLCDICIRVPSDNTPRIQESHVAVVHIICELLEKELAQG